MIRKIHYTDEGYEIVVRTASETDAENLIALKKNYIKGTHSIPLYEDEYKNTPQQETELIKRYHSEQNSVLLVAEHNNVLIGNLDITGNQRRKLFHTGMIGMGIANAWQNRKIGSMLMQEALDWAAASPLEILWLEVYSTNLAGIKLYEKYGFEKCGLMKDFFREEIKTDKVTMIKYII